MRWGFAQLLTAFVCATLGVSSVALGAKDCLSDLRRDSGRERRLACLAPMFDPAPGELARLDARELRIEGKKHPFAVRGYLHVTPPPGECLTIRRSEDSPDARVCRAQDVSFSAADLDDGGRFHWMVSVGKGDFGTKLTWPTPHRVARVMEALPPAKPQGDKDPKPEPTPTFLKKLLVDRCAIDMRLAGGDRWKRARTFPVVLMLADGRQWILHFPEKDVLAKDQGRDIDNLYKNTYGGFGLSVGPKEEAPKPAEGAHGEAPKAEGAHGEAPKAEEGKDGSAPSLLTTQKKQRREMWVVAPRGAFQLDVRDFVDIGSPGGVNGFCRYHLEGAPLDPSNGWFECHGVAGMDVVISPMACTQDLLTWRNNSIK
jgi:hypothetical protein